MITFSTQVTRIRWTEQGDERAELPASFLPEGRLLLPKDSDVDEGDMVEEIMPNGDKKTFRLSKVNFMNAGWGSGALDHTEAHLEPVADRPGAAAGDISVPGMHSAVAAAAGSHFDDGHYTSATFEALKAVEERVRRLSKVDLSGKELMSHVFGGTAPKLDVTTTTGQSADDEREGFALLFMGAVQGLGTPRGHGTSIVDEPAEALECLAVASLLMRRLDIAEGELRGS